MTEEMTEPGHDCATDGASVPAAAGGLGVREMARALGCSASLASRYRGRGMPMSSVDEARKWMQDNLAAGLLSVRLSREDVQASALDASALLSGAQALLQGIEGRTLSDEVALARVVRLVDLARERVGALDGATRPREPGNTSGAPS